MFVVSLVSAVLAVSSPSAESPSRPHVADVVQKAAMQLADLKLESEFKPELNPILRLADPLKFDLQGIPAPLDYGSAVSSDTRAVLALVLGLLVGFGIGHLVARDRGGFILFLVVDIVIIAVSSVFHFATRGFFWGIGGLALLISHIIQGLDAYASAGGERLVQEVRKNTVLIADTGRDSALPTTRAFAFTF